MKKDQEKENIERYHLEVFSELHKLPGKELMREKYQKPDFRFDDEGRITGIEHTRLKFSTKLPELKGIQRKIVAKAQKIAEQNEIPPLEVLVYFHDYFNRYRKNVNQIALALYTTINSNLQSILKIENGHSVKIEPPEPFVGILMIHAKPGKIYGNTWLEKHRWRINEVGFVNQYFINDLQSRIDKKNLKIKYYLNYCDTCWLLIVADRYKADQKYNFTNDMKNHIFKSNFSKVFFLEIADRLLIQLRIDKS